MKITIEQFQSIYRVSQMQIDEFEQSTMYVQILTDKSVDEINRMKLSKFNALCRKIKKAFDLFSIEMNNKKPKDLVKANGNWYHLSYDLSKMTAGKYVEAATFGNDIVGNIHKLMATMATPMKLTWKGLKIDDKKRSHTDIADDMLQLDFETAYHACVFFYVVFNKSIVDSLPYLQSQTDKKNEVAMEVMSLLKNLDGFTTAKWYQNMKTSV